MVLRIEKREYREPSGILWGITNKIIKIKAVNDQHIIALLDHKSYGLGGTSDGLSKTIESNDCGKNWTYINGNRAKAAKSCAEELIWRTEKGEIIPQF